MNGLIGRVMSLSDDLEKTDIESIKFLCRDFNIDSRLENCTEGKDVFQNLIERGLITDENIDILVECFSQINRPDWIKSLCFKPDEVRHKGSKLNPFRVMLFNLSENITDEEMLKIPDFLKNLDLGQQKCNISRCISMVQVFTCCEKMGILDKRNLDIIYSMLKYIKRNDLLDKVNEYAEKAGIIHSHDPLRGLGSYQSHEQMNTFGSPPKFWPRNAYEFSSPYRPGGSFECPSSLEKTQWPELCTSEDNIEPGHLTGQPSSHDSDTIFQPVLSRFTPHSGLIVPPLTYDVITEVSFIPDLTYEFYSTKANNSYTSQILNDQFRNKTVSTSLPGSEKSRATTGTCFMAGRQIATGTGFVEGREAVTGARCFMESQKVIAHPLSPLVPVSEASRQSQKQAEPFNCYKMDAVPRGLCLIINNKEFFKIENDKDSVELEHREGTDIDCEKLKNLFTKLHFVVKVEHNQSDLQMRQLMSCVSKNDHSAYDCFVCCILSHGSEGNVFGTNGKEVPIVNLTGFFLSANCPSLAGKPKVFFIQACQGSKKQSGYKVEQDAPDIDTDAPPARIIPNEADFLLGFATVAGYASFRNTVTGTWYINKLVQMLEKYHEREDVLSIFARVNMEVCSENAEDDDSSNVYKQTPAPTFTLTKRLFF